MKNLQTIIAQLTEKGLRFEVEYPQSFTKYSFDKVIDMDNSGTQEDAKLGIEIKNGVWAWFTFSTLSDYIFFKQRYNANIGKAVTAWSTGYKIMQDLKEKYNIELR